jgi:hypothetical protein
MLHGWRVSSSSTSTRLLQHRFLRTASLVTTHSLPSTQLSNKHRLHSTMATAGLSTLHHVTDRKLKKLAGHREKFEADKKAILTSVAVAPTTQDKLQALLDGFKKYDVTVKDSELPLPNLRRFARQAKHDPSVSKSLLQDWQAQLEHEMDVGSRKYEYAALFGNLVIEWIKHPNPAATAAEKDSPNPNNFKVDLSDSFDKIGRKEMHEQRKVWEEYAFTEKKVDQAKIKAYLDDIFDTALQVKKVKKSPLQMIRESMKNAMDFKSEIQTPEDEHNKPVVNRLDTFNRFTVDLLKSCIQGVLQSDLLAGQKREALAELKNQPAVLGELVDVLNMDLDGLDTWEWDPTPIPLHMRRQLNGKYRVYMDEETHQAILLQFIGKYWAVRFKDAFTTFYRSDAWHQTPFRSMSKKARQRREYFDPDSTTSTFTVRDRRRDDHRDEYFMTQLPDNIEDDYRDYGADEEKRSQSGKRRSPLETKQAMLRLVTTEIMVNTKIYGSSLVWQSDFKWHGPSLPHNTIFAVLEFFGVPGKWLRFFKKFLEAPLVFAQDGPEAEVHVRRRGVPMSHMISDVLSEAVLFCLDFAVNKRTQGANIYRFHDDLWFWGQESTCVQAWDALKEFTTIMGLDLNDEKSGSALIVADEAKPRSPPQALPQGKIKWGFLTLDAATGRWVIDRNEVDQHIEELQRQLSACRSVMAWVQAWNSYVSRFFTNNFGNPANCFGQQHNDMIIDTFAHIQRSLFADSGAASVTEHLRAMLKERFGTDDSVPDGFFYYPIEAGGLGLRNPLINAFMTYNDTAHDPAKLIDRAFEDEREGYERAKERWESGEHRSKEAHYAPVAREDTETENEVSEAFMSFAEFTRYREELSMPLRISYQELMECPREETATTSEALRVALIRSSLDDSPYWMWIYNLYSSDMMKQFGGQGLQLGERDLLPVGLVGVLKSEKVRWEG